MGRRPPLVNGALKRRSLTPCDAKVPGVNTPGQGVTACYRLDRGTTLRSVTRAGNRVSQCTSANLPEPAVGRGAPVVPDGTASF
jgi:hypothetical protein